MIADVPNGVAVPIFDAHPTLDVLNASEFTFYLTGSRFAGTAGDASDWDFFAAHSLAVESRLLDEGFKLLSMPDETYQGDDESHPYTRMVFGKGDVHVQVVENIDVARRTRDLVYSQFREWDDEARIYDKSRRGDLWVRAGQLVGMTMPRPALAPTPNPLFETTGDDSPF